MNAHQKRVLQSFRRVQNWMAARPELSTTTPIARLHLATGAPVPAADPAHAALAEQATALDAVVESASTLASDQESHFRGSKGSTAEASQLRAELFTYHIRPVAAMARVAIPDVVRMTEALRTPKANIDAEGLIAAAGSMAKASEEYAKVLVKRGLPADFVAQLRSAATQYRGAIDARGRSLGGRRGATEGLKDTLGRGRKLVEGISVIVTRLLREDAQALAEWRQIKRVTVKGVQPGVQPDVTAVTQPAEGAPATVTPAEQKAA